MVCPRLPAYNILIESVVNKLNGFSALQPSEFFQSRGFLPRLSFWAQIMDNSLDLVY